MTIVGREDELAVLDAAFSSALVGRPTLVELYGSAGIGKTALMEALGEVAKGRGARVVGARLYGAGQTEAYRGATELLRDLLEQVHEKPGGFARWWGKYGATGLAVASDVLGIIPGLSIASVACKAVGLLAPGKEDAAAPEAVLGKYRDNRVALFCDLVIATARDPLLITIDDVQWADAGTVEVLAALMCAMGAAKASAPVKLAIAWTLRGSDADEGIVGRLHAARDRHMAAASRSIPVGPVRHEATHALVQALAPLPVELSPAFTSWLASTSEGNPLALRSILAFLVDRGVLVERLGALTLTEPFTSAGPPSSLLRAQGAIPRNAVVSDTLALPAPVLRLLEAGAAWGRSFPVRPTLAMAGLARGDGIEATRSATRRGLVGPGTPLFVGGSIEPTLTFGSEAHAEAFRDRTPDAVARAHATRVARWTQKRAADAVAALEGLDDSTHTAALQADRLSSELVRWSRLASERLAAADEPLAALRVLIDAERCLSVRREFGNRSEGASDHDRLAVHRFLQLANHVDSAVADLRSQIHWPGHFSDALVLEVVHALICGEKLVELSWYSRATHVLDTAENALNVLADPDLRLRFLQRRASLAFAAGEVGRGRQLVSDLLHHAREEGIDADELPTLLQALFLWPDVAPVRALLRWISEHQPPKDEVLATGLLEKQLEDAAFPPWDPAQRSALEPHLQSDRPRSLRALVGYVRGVWDVLYGGGDLGIPGLAEAARDAIGLLDQVAELARVGGLPDVELSARTSAHDALTSALRSVDALAGEERAAVRAVLASPLFAKPARRERLDLLRACAGGAPPHATRMVLILDPLLPADDAAALATAALWGQLDLDKLRVAKALLDRKDAGQEAKRRAAEWLQRARARAGIDADLAADAGTELAKYFEAVADLAAARAVWSEVARARAELGDYEEHEAAERHVARLERKISGARAGRAPRARRTGLTQLPPDDVPIDPLAAEQAAERAIAAAQVSADLQYAQVLLERAIELYSVVPDGATRVDDIYEILGGLWNDEGDALLEAGDIDDALRAFEAAHAALLQALEHNESLGDFGRVHELSGRLLRIIGGRVVGTGEGTDDYLALTRGRFRRAMSLGDFDRAADSIEELGDLEKNAASEATTEVDGESRDNGWRQHIPALRDLRAELVAAFVAKARAEGEPWQIERHRVALGEPQTEA